MQGRLENDIKLQRVTDEIVKDLPDYVREWYIDMKASDKSMATCYDYVKKIRLFFEYITDDAKNFDVSEIDLQKCESFLISIQTQKQKNGIEDLTSYAYQRSMKCAINSFIKFLIKKQYLPYDFTNDIKIIKKNSIDEINKKRLLTQRDFNKILLAAKEGNGYKGNFLGNRDVLIILLFMTTAIKKTTMSEINLEDIDIGSRTLSVIDRKDTHHIYHLNEQVMYYLDKWLIDRKQIETSESGTALFISLDGHRLGDDSIYNIVKNNCYKGIGKRMSPQQIRIGVCSILYNKTHDKELISQAIGYADMQMPRQYVQRKERNKKKAVKIMSDILNK